MTAVQETDEGTDEYIGLLEFKRVAAKNQMTKYANDPKAAVLPKITKLVGMDQFLLN